ncbi:hypothetical protein X740_33195 [Mesorhizobium sp. LNHC221B00]|uniref:hypothetical protein n=1 Tax=Mesorhizobium sp. LNHC221B00 TaxID=1287233 RepID=UPI0003CE3159|nr:hypothetical protein [Mesorhizobium sp. LNHC221B00]ESY72520.1 hypothetical protein X740_33195 [Mesorhizobium sp. LNHC221B00]
MKRLLEIAPAGTSKTVVRVGDDDIEVGKVSAKRLTGLLMRYPELGDLMGGKKASPLRLIEIAADAGAALIAAGCGYHGEDTLVAEARAAELDIQDQINLVVAIATITYPPFGPMIDQLKSRVAIFLQELEKSEAPPAGETLPTE